MMTAESSTSTWDGEHDVLASAALFLAPGACLEVRVPKPARTGRYKPAPRGGWFNDPAALLAAARAIDGRADGVYVTMNPVHPALLSRAIPNTLQDLEPDQATKDHEIVSRRWLLLDLDPVRPKGVSATPAELEAALDRARAVHRALLAEGWPRAVAGGSGNGAHLLYRIDLPRDDGGLVARVLAALAFRFDDPIVSVDPKVANASRIVKLYGTLACKGASTAERPHRRARLAQVPDPLAVVPAALLQRVAAWLPAKPVPARRQDAGRGDPIDLAAQLAAWGLAVARAGPWQHGHRWVLEACPWNPEHTDRSAFVVQFASGAVAAGCLHAGCAGRSWRDLRALFEPPAGPAGYLEAPDRPPDHPPDRPGADAQSTQSLPTSAAVLVPGAHSTPDGYVEVGQDDFARAVLTRLPPGVLYRRGHVVGELLGLPGGRSFQVLGVDRARVLLDYHVRLVAWRARDGGPEQRFEPCARDRAAIMLAGAASDPGVRDLRGIYRHPIYLPGFRRAVPGWDEQAGIFYDPPPNLEPLLPTRDQAEARAVLEDLVVDFPFADPASRTNLFGLLLTPILRPALAGNVPLHLVGSSLERTGKSLLVEHVVGTLLTGTPISATPIPAQEEERQKAALALLLGGATLQHLDNLPAWLDSASLASLVTARQVTGRLLGQSLMVTLENHLTVILSGNNVRTSSEIAKRTVSIRLQPHDEHPEARTDFEHADLEGFVRARRPVLLGALLGLVDAWLAAGRPAPRQVLGGFESWVHAVGGVLAHAGYADWLGNAEAFREASDSFGADREAFLALWRSSVPVGEYRSATQLYELADGADLFAETVSGKDPKGRVLSFAKRVLMRVVGQPAGSGLRVDRMPGAGCKLYRLWQC